MEEELRSLMAEEAKLSKQTPRAPERLKQVQQWIGERSMALQVQSAVVEDNEQRVVASEAKLRAAEMELDFMDEAKESLDQTLAQEAQASATVAATLHAKELRTGKMYLKKLDAAKKKVEDIEDEQYELKESVINAGYDLNDEAKDRLKESMAKVKRHADKGKELNAQQNEARRQAVSGLKGSLEEKQKKELQEKEFQDLHDQGLNPYEVYRRRDVEAAAAKQRQTIADNIAERQVVVARQLALEEENRQKVLETKDAERRALERFNKGMSPHANELKTEAYIQKHTIGNLSMLDPTGRLPVDPSSVTVFKTNDFGLGRAEPKLLERMADERVMMRSLSINMKDDDDEFDAATGDSPPASPRATRNLARGNTDLGATGATGAAGGGDGWKVLESRPLTKLEKANLEAAKERHKETIGKEKEMMGTRFGGDAFMSTPEVVVFKDFEIPAEHGNVLEVNYKLPGYLATGVSGELLLTFTPKVNEDIDTRVEMLADTGPFNIQVL
eukprot:gene1975-33392_t